MLVHNDKRYEIADDGRLIWIIGGKTYEQELEGFPLYENLKRPEEISNKAAPTD